MTSRPTIARRPFRMAASPAAPAAAGLLALCLACTLDAGDLTWTLVADQTVVSTPSETLTRSLRGLAVDDGATLLYGGFIQKSLGSGARVYSLAGDPPVGSIAAFFNVTGITPSGADHQPKTIAVDDRGFVFVGSSKDSTSGDNARVIILDPGLSTSQVFVLADIDFPGITGERVDGLHVRRVGSDYFVYASRRHPGSAYIERYALTGSSVGGFGLSLDPTFNGTGRYSLRTDGGFPTAADLKGIAVSDDGTIFVASRTAGLLYRIPADLSTASAVAVSTAMDVALFGGRAYVSQYDGNQSAIAEVDAATMTVLSQFDAFDDFPRDAGSTGDVAGYSGIHIDDAGHIWLADQFYFQNSTESRDRILRSSALPQPAPQIELVVELAGSVDAGPFTRCIQFAFGCGGPVVLLEMTFENGVATATIPLPKGDFDCVSARDPLHTLRSVATISESGGDSCAAFTGPSALRGGDLSGDGVIDILDFGLFVGAFGGSPGASTTCDTIAPHGDIDGDGIVDADDFSFIQINFFQVDASCVCPMTAMSPKPPLRRARVAELERLGAAHAARADRDGDGWVDAIDLALFLAGR